MTTTPQDILNETIAQAPLMFALGIALGRKIDGLALMMRRRMRRLDQRVDAIEKHLGIEPPPTDEDDEENDDGR